MFRWLQPIFSLAVVTSISLYPALFSCSSRYEWLCYPLLSASHFPPLSHARIKSPVPFLCLSLSPECFWLPRGFHEISVSCLSFSYDSLVTTNVRFNCAALFEKQVSCLCTNVSATIGVTLGIFFV